MAFSSWPSVRGCAATPSWSATGGPADRCLRPEREAQRAGHRDLAVVHANVGACAGAVAAVDRRRGRGAELLAGPGRRVVAGRALRVGQLRPLQLVADEAVAGA